MPTYPLTGSDAAEIEARLNVFRLGQTRLGFMDPTLRVTIGGSERQTSIDKSSLRITKLVEGPSTATFTMFANKPQEGQEVKIGIGSISNLVFAGHITAVKSRADGLSTNVRYAVSCQDHTWLLDRLMVMASYHVDTVESIIARILSVYTSGFTMDHVDRGLGRLEDGMTFTMETVSGCLRRLATEVGAHWYVDPYKDIHFFSADRVPNPHDLTTSYKDFENVTYEVDLSQIRTRVLVEGSGTTTTAAYTLDSVVLNVEDNSMFYIGGGLARIGDYRFLIYTTTVGSTQLSITPASGGDLLGDYGTFPIGTPVNLWTVEEDTAAQAVLAALEGGNGLHEHYVQDRRLGLRGSIDRAQADLTKYKSPIERITYRTHDPNTRPGARITVSLSAPTTISGTFVIQRVTMTDVEQATNRHPWYDVEATSTIKTLWDIYQATINKGARP